MKFLLDTTECAMSKTLFSQKYFMFSTQQKGVQQLLLKSSFFFFLTLFILMPIQPWTRFHLLTLHLPINPNFIFIFTVFENTASTIRLIDVSSSKELRISAIHQSTKMHILAIISSSLCTLSDTRNTWLLKSY